MPRGPPPVRFRSAAPDRARRRVGRRAFAAAQRAGERVLALGAGKDRLGERPVEIVARGLGGGQKRQRLLGLAPLFLKRQRHRRQLGIRVLEPVAQPLGGGGIGQPLGLERGDLFGVFVPFALERRDRLGGGIGPGLQIGDQRLQRLASRCRQPRRLGLRVDFVARGSQREVRRVARALGLARAVAGGVQVLFEPGDPVARLGAIGQKCRDPRLEIGDLRPCAFERLVLRRALGRERRDPVELRLGLRARLRQLVAEPADLGVTLGGARPFETERRAEPLDLLAQGVEFALLSGDGVAQHELHHRENRQHEHQHQKQAGHRIDEARPDRRLEAVGAATLEAHGSKIRMAARGA
ncbi:hypothetical protein MBELCI_1364 [Limimaricola cinnabarinus LL-001]|uniref:Uncharacterized protein n=1 Tax=Limimaricola cinnabarinus LL-001 TaxID=1337093 RepID=U2Z2P1_9RHOB|nr:hypothetical protein [Limimaricola cinnabarinus]GAD55312.1 hypothetical protein MBELCI_1364 [Limimaricola cinnabarinus LL-001]